MNEWLLRREFSRESRRSFKEQRANKSEINRCNKTAKIVHCDLNECWQEKEIFLWRHNLLLLTCYLLESCLVAVVLMCFTDFWGFCQTKIYCKWTYWITRQPFCLTLTALTHSLEAEVHCRGIFLQNLQSEKILKRCEVHVQQLLSGKTRSARLTSSFDLTSSPCPSALPPIRSLTFTRSHSTWNRLPLRFLLSSLLYSSHPPINSSDNVSHRCSHYSARGASLLHLPVMDFQCFEHLTVTWSCLFPG